MKEIRTKADMSYLLDQIYLLKSVQLPSIAKSIERFNKKFIKEQSQPVESKQSVTKMVEPESVDDDEVGGFYFDTNAPLMDMTQVMTEMQQLKGSMKKEETLSIKDSPEDTGTKDDFQETRRTKVQISQDSVKARTKSLAVAVSKPSNTALTLLKLQRLCKHLAEYPETREIAIMENLIPILLRQRNHVDDANQAEIRRALSLMGYADPVKGKGIRILSVDGGGSRGVIPIEILKRLEESCQLKIGDMFDYVIGVSSGAVTAFLLSIAKASTEECEQLYKDLSSTVFGRNRFLGTSNLVLNHAFYDTERWIKMLREHFQGMGNLPISETARDASCPKVASVATLMNVGMMRDYLFRNYNLPPGSVSFYQGSSKYCLWEALRASSAAPGYFEEFKLDDHVFQDGGVLTNNPCALAVHECRLLWPDTPIQCVVSVGTGRYDPMDQEFPAEYSSLRTKLFKVLCSATDTEAVHIILKDLLPAGKYFRFNPVLSEDFLLDESKPEKLEQMQKDTRSI
ncbi:putative phospholipase A I [Apostichopus japonicus]|uniref:Putative phospholipase A I n=1 Tax=Stichopus japonicus TaxID=307972 RepID=A0A2G8KC22_STIJA|nr:putative phospholipase A I [Apostichopus japonicus]